MPKYKWEGLNSDGKKVSSEIEASSEKEARRLLRAQGSRVRKITPPGLLDLDLGEWMVEKGFASAFGARELMHFTKQLSTMINAGVPILLSLEILFKSEKQAILKKSIQRIATSVGEGQTLAEAMEKEQGFDKLYCNLVKAGEMGGILDTILDKIAIHMEKQEKTKKQIKSAMMYPAIVCVVGTGVVWGLMTFVVPQFIEMLNDSNQEIPAITQFVIDVSRFCEEYTLVALPSFFIGGIVLKSYLSTPSGKSVFDKVMMNFPVFGEIIVKGNLSSFTRTLSTLLSSGVSLIDSLDICVETIDNSFIKKDIKQVRKKVVEGKTLADPLSKIDYFPAMVSQMIKVGEQTGGIDEMLIKVADVFEEDVNNAVDTGTKMIEPIIILGLGSVIAVVLVAMYLPIFMQAGGA